MRKSYKLYNHEYCKAHVEIHFDENKHATGIELWSYNTRVCGAYKTANDGWTLFCTGTYSQTTRRQISWFSNKPWVSKRGYRDWKLYYSLFKEILGAEISRFQHKAYIAFIQRSHNGNTRINGFADNI